MIGEWFSNKPENRFISRNFLLFVGLLMIIFFFNLAYAVYSFIHTLQLSEVIASEELPRARGIQEAISAMLNSRFILGEAAGLIDFSDLEKIRVLESDLNSSILVFDSYIAAFTWGSESASFKKSDGGLNFAEWHRLGLYGNLVINYPSFRQAQLAGATDIYFSGFSINAIKAIRNHKKYLRLANGGDDASAREAQMLSLQQLAKSRYFFNLAASTLSVMAEESNTAATQKAEVVNKTQKTSTLITIIVFTLGFLISIGVIFIYARKSKDMMEELVVAAKLLIRKDREFSH
ncbi:MAG: hypothetical protein AAB930_01250, partial [Patescibacteria group bacterium]